METLGWLKVISWVIDAVELIYEGKHEKVHGSCHLRHNYIKFWNGNLKKDLILGIIDLWK